MEKLDYVESVESSNSSSSENFGYLSDTLIIADSLESANWSTLAACNLF